MIKPNINDVILDLGCGTGKQIIELSRKVKLAIGVDISDGMIRQAKENIENERIHNIELYIGTFEEPNSNFDFTVEVHRLHPLVGVMVANRNRIDH